MHQWSTTPLNNQTADSRANWQEGQPASSLNNSARGMMATAAFWRDDNLGTLVATLGANNVYTVTTGQGLIDPASTSGGGTAKISHPFSLRVVLPAMNTPVATTAPTIIVDGAAAVPLVRRDGSPVADNDLTGLPYEILGDTITSGAYTRARVLDFLPSQFGGLFVAPGGNNTVPSTNSATSAMKLTNFGTIDNGLGADATWDGALARLTINKAGLYIVGCGFDNNLPLGSSGYGFSLAVGRNSGALSIAAMNGISAGFAMYGPAGTTSAPVRLAADDYLELFGAHNYGSALNFQARFFVERTGG